MTPAISMAIVALGSVAVFFGVRWLIRDDSEFSSSQRFGAVFAACVLATPGVLSVLYYLHWFDDWMFYYRFRTWPGIEFLSIGAGAAAGILSRVSEKVGAGFLLGLALIGVVIPFLKPIVRPLAASEMEDRWDGEVCRQSTGSTCGPASAATILRHFGVTASESELARESWTSGSGTEVWYLARALRRRGFSVQFRHAESFPERIDSPVIAGVMLGGSIGHFIALLPIEGNSFRVCDPAGTNSVLDRETFLQRYDFTGFLMEVEKSQPVPNHS